MARFTSTAFLLLMGSMSAWAAADSGLLSLLPADTQTVASVNVDSSRSSSFGQFLLRQMSANDKSIQDMVDQTGFDPRRDLQTLVIAGLPSTGTTQDNRFAVLARGLFNEPMITARAIAKGMVSSTVAGTTVLTSSSGKPVALAFPENGIAVFGDRSTVEQVLNNRANPSTLTPDLQNQISSASASNDAWFASVVPGSKLITQMPQAGSALGGSHQRSQLMQGVLQSNGGIRFGNNVQLSFSALTRSDKDATSLTDLIRFLSSAIQMQRDNDPRAALLAPAMDSLKLSADGRQVSSSFIIPEGDLEQIMVAQGKTSGQARK